MNEKTKTIGIDGREYDSSTARILGDRHALMERQMAEDIQQQNKLLQQNMQLQQDIANQNYELEMQKEENRKLEAEKQREHDKEMRLLKLFDDIGISKETYTNYVNNIFSLPNEEFSKKIIELGRDAQFIQMIAEADKSKLGDVVANCSNSDEDRFIKLYNKYVEPCFEGPSNDEISKVDKEINKYYVKRERQSIVAAVSSVSSLISVCLYSANLRASKSGIFVTLFIVFCLISLLFIIMLVNTSRKIKMLNYRISYKKLDEEKFYNNISEAFKSFDKILSKSREELITKIKPQYENFLNFRKVHYNSKIEKLLIDVGYKDLVTNVGLQYETVNNSNKKKDGTIEDYIEYFETNS